MENPHPEQSVSETPAAEVTQREAGFSLSNKVRKVAMVTKCTLDLARRVLETEDGNVKASVKKLLPRYPAVKGCHVKNVMRTTGMSWTEAVAHLCPDSDEVDVQEVNNDAQENDDDVQEEDPREAKVRELVLAIRRLTDKAGLDLDLSCYT